jgi:hypothetical protein
MHECGHETRCLHVAWFVTQCLSSFDRDACCNIARVDLLCFCCGRVVVRLSLLTMRVFLCAGFPYNANNCSWECTDGKIKGIGAGGRLQCLDDSAGSDVL